MVKIETRCRIPIRRTFGRIPWHVIPEPPATLQGVRIPSAILKIVFRHILFLPAGLYVAQPCRYCFAQRSKNGFFAPQGRHVAPINVKFGMGSGQQPHAKFCVHRGRNVGKQPPKLSKCRILVINLPLRGDSFAVFLRYSQRSYASIGSF